MTKTTFASLLALLVVAPALAHHRQTPSVVALTHSGDTALPRLGSFNGVVVLAVPTGTGHAIYRYKYPYPDPPIVIATAGDNANPVVSINGAVIAWDSDGDLAGSHDPGRQIYMTVGSTVVQVARDPTGTSSNAAISGTGSRIAFESTGDLAGANPGGVRQVFLRGPDGSVTQMSRGRGTSGNVTIDGAGGVMAFESTSDGATGADTGLSQIWLVNLRTGGAGPITTGKAPSHHPVLSSDGRLMAFDSAADLAGDGTGGTQVYVYDTHSGDFARLTDDPNGCVLPAIHKFRRDWRISYVCGGQAFFYLLLTDEAFLVPAATGDTTRVVAEGGFQFLILSTTADLLNGGTTAGHQAYLVNLYKRQATRVTGTAVWFPERGLPPAR